MSERAREIAELLAAGVGGAAMTGFWGWLQRRTSNAAENKTGEAAILGAATRLQEVMNNAAELAATRWAGELEASRAEALRLRDRVEALEQHIKRIEGEARQYRQHAESLEAVLIRNGIDLSAAMAPGALLVVDGDAATVTPPPRTRRRRP